MEFSKSKNFIPRQQSDENYSLNSFDILKSTRGPRLKKNRSLKDARYDMEKDLISAFQLAKHKEIIDWTD